jgi:hypothetical protein
MMRASENIKALTYALIFSLPNIVGYFFFERIPPSLLYLTDKLFFLKHSSDLGQFYPHVTFYAEHIKQVSFERIYSLYPYAILEFLVGYLGAIFQLQPALFGIAVDLIFVFLSYRVFRALASRFLDSSLLIEIATAICLFLPWIFCPWFYHSFGLPGFPQLVAPEFKATLYALPVLRTMATQVSYPLWGFVLILFFDVFLGDERGRFKFYAVGVLSGLSFYFYFFTWLTIVILFSIILVFGFRTYLKTIKLLDCLAAAACHIVIILPGLWILIKQLGHHSKSFQAEATLVTDYWYFSFDNLFLFVFFLFLYFRKLEDPRLQFAVLLAAACQLTDFLALNLQPLFGIYLEPWHVPTLFTGPINSLVFVILLGNGQFALRMKLLVNGLGVVAILGSIATPLYLSQLYLRKEAFSWSSSFLHDDHSLIQYLKTNVSPGNVIAYSSVKEPFPEVVPTEFAFRNVGVNITAFSGQYVLKQHKVSLHGVSEQEEFERELLTSWFLSGKLQLLWPCENISEQYDLFTATWNRRQSARSGMCDLARELESKSEVCDLLAKYKVDYYIHESAIVPSIPDSVSRFTKLEWTSPNQKYRLLSFDATRALEYYCRE